MMQAIPTFDYPRLRDLELSESPYRYTVHDATVLDPERLNLLCRNFPDIIKVGHNSVKDVVLCDVWRMFVAEVRSPAYRQAMEHVTGLDLSGYDVGIGFRKLSKRSHGAPHCDVPRKRVTHLIYFNDKWPHQTGRLRILRSANLEDASAIVTPLSGHGVIFRVGRRSYHGFEPFEGVRKAVQINFEKSNLFSRVFARYAE